MAEPGDGGPAFPRATHNQKGMSLRDYFAGQALAGVVMSVSAFAESHESIPFEVMRARVVAEAYAIADAMLAERKEAP